MKDRVSLLWWLGLSLAFLIQPLAFAEDELPRYELGAAFNAIRSVPNNNVGLGGRGVYNPTSYLSFEAEINGFLANSPATGLNGGRILEGLVGAKAGLRHERFGIFGKVRPGIISFSNTVRQINVTPLPFPISLPLPIGVPTFRTGRLTRPALDLGGVVEIYPAKNWSLRYDFGDTMVFYSDQHSSTLFGPITVPGSAKHRLQFSAGIHYRF